MKTITTGANKAGRRYSIAQEGNNFYVLVECSNYAPHLRGGIAKTWRVEDIRGRTKLTRDEATDLYARKLAGKAKP